MKNSLTVLTNSKGLTIIEMLIGGFMSLLIVAGVMEFYLKQHNQWIAQENISDMQQNLRVASDEISAKLRMAGYGLPDGVRYIYAANNNPDSLRAIVFSKGPGCNPTIEHAMPQPSAELRCDGHDLSCFNADEWAYIFDPTTKTGEFFYITLVQYASSHIQHNTMSLSKAYPKGSFVISVEAFKYYIDNSTDPAHPKLMRAKNFDTAEVFAEDIEDLQFVYTLSTGATTDSPSASDVIKSVYVTVVAKTGKKDEYYASNSGFRKRTIQTKVFIRNSS